MPDRSARFETLTMLGCCALVALGPDARGADRAQPTPATSMAAELSTFEAGLWEYRRIAVASDSARPRFATLRKCADPSTEIRTKMAQLKSRDCQFAPVVRRDGGYVSSWTCPTPQGPISFRHVLIIRDATSYLAMSEARLGQRLIQQKMEARRVGECPAAVPRAPAMPARPLLPPTQK
jgi:hypothetical protein